MNLGVVKMEEKRIRKNVAIKTFVIMAVILATPFIALGLYYNDQIGLEGGGILLILAILAALEIYFRKPPKNKPDRSVAACVIIMLFITSAANVQCTMSPRKTMTSEIVPVNPGPTKTASIQMSLGSNNTTASKSEGYSTESIQYYVVLVGSRFNITFSVSDANNLYGWCLSVIWDQKIIIEHDVYEGSLLQSAGDTIFCNNFCLEKDGKPGVYNLTQFIKGDYLGAYGSGELFTIAFSADVTGTVTISVNNAYWMNSKLENYALPPCDSMELIVVKPLCALKTTPNGYFYVPNATFVNATGLRVEMLFDQNSNLTGDQAGGSTPYPAIANYPDGVVDGSDLAVIAWSFGTSEAQHQPRWNYMADVNGDGIVDGGDLALAAHNWGRSYGSYTYNLSQVQVTFNTGGGQTPDADGFVAIPPAATSFNVTRNGTPIGAMIIFCGP
jgi:hypothetical protein